MEAATRQAKRDLLRRAGLRGDYPARRLRGGRNNRVWRLGLNGTSLLLKEYYHGPEEARDRQAVEWGFLNFAWDAGLRDLPQPLAAIPESHAALLSFLPGRRLRRNEAAWPHLEQAALFIAALNRHGAHPAARKMPLASDACLGLQDHLACLARRLRRLRDVADEPARAFVHLELDPAGKAAVRCLRQWAAARGLDPRERLAPGDHCLSPSDFGFQNALLDGAGRLRFLDFEYAGWDDPAKLVCDFFAQPEVAVDLSYLETFTRKAFAERSDLEVILHRARALLPIHWLKWCCILLGEFLPDQAERRSHAADQSPSTARLARQLAKARAHLRRMPQPNPTR